MDDGGFKLWLAAIRDLTAEQRGHGFRALAMAEAGDDTDMIVPAPPGTLVSPLPAVLRPTRNRSADAVSATTDGTGNAAPAGSVSDLASLVVAGHNRIDRTGCPHCGSQKLQGWGRVSGLPRYRCVDCRRSFNALTGTPLARLRKKEQWAAQAQALITGESVVRAAKRCDVAVSTAFRWRHRFLSAPARDKPAQLSGIVEADETYIRESFKGKRSDLPRLARKRGSRIKKRGLATEQIAVLVARDRSGRTTDAVLA